MSGGEDKAGEKDSAAEGDAPKPKGKKKLVLIAGVVVALLVVVGGLGAMGMLPFLHHAPPPKKNAQVASVSHEPVFIDLPEMVVNLDAGPRREVFAKVQCRVEADSSADGALVTPAIPRIIDMLQTYLRAMRPEELKSGAGLYRLKEAFLARATIVVPAARLDDILFQELIIQ